MATITRERLHQLVDALDDDEIATAGRLLAALVDDDPVGLALATAPLDDEPETDDERAAVDEAKADIAAGRVLTTEQVRRSLGL
jgi:hypothetical protein